MTGAICLRSFLAPVRANAVSQVSDRCLTRSRLPLTTEAAERGAKCLLILLSVFKILLATNKGSAGLYHSLEMLVSFRHTLDWSSLGEKHWSGYLPLSIPSSLPRHSFPEQHVYLSLFWKFSSFHKAGVQCPQGKLFSKSYSSTMQYFEGMLNECRLNKKKKKQTIKRICPSESILRITKSIYFSKYLKVFSQDPIHTLFIQKYCIICGNPTELYSVLDNPWSCRQK